ncbi:MULTISPECIES: nuclear transport factor 2 family protein [unclassified Janthinobacterium]|uniref:nuclear transport factor 2 family protein n=1 Tax=unclassified Janthinobacterium TaxID=2610881 RepID=UPI001E5D091A|nr:MULTISPECIES: nuclear transport factor 2 family protein [unclassified Janthinobacterium]MCC7643068.1 nuclear transport factor 2 family protein [Janthinobacterium sp. EB271-G4-3-1]MCC7691515.1 nuclear transport factor 2 family protein [Janthinobacterium sp. EB271-G4-3-2]
MQGKTMIQFLVRTVLACYLLGITAVGTAATADQDEHAIQDTVRLYLHGTSFNVQGEINQAFHANARLYLDGKDDAEWELSGPEYAKLFSDEKKGQFNGRHGRLIKVEVNGKVATAKAEIHIPRQGVRYVDVFLLKKIAGNWKIVSKSAHREQAARHARKVLLVVSNVHQYPGTKVNAGNNFPELAYTYDAFRKAGYAVDFVSPEGGAVPLEMIVTSDELLKKYLYDSDFMWALAHTKPVAEVKADEYAGMAFVGGGAAIVGIPDNKPLQDIALRIYEQQGGVIAAICHGTEGIKNLKLSDGTFLIQGKVLTSFPDAFLNKESPVYKAYPFSAEGSIKRQGGIFRHGASGKSHVEVDGRLVTGMSWESSVGVAESMIRLIQQ